MLRLKLIRLSPTVTDAVTTATHAAVRCDAEIFQTMSESHCTAQTTGKLPVAI